MCCIGEVVKMLYAGQEVVGWVSSLSGCKVFFFTFRILFSPGVRIETKDPGSLVPNS